MTEDSDDSYLARQVEPGGAELGQRIDELLEHALPDSSPNLSLYREMLVTVVRMAQTNPARWDTKILLQTLKPFAPWNVSADGARSRYSARRALRSIMRSTDSHVNSVPPWPSAT